MLSNQHDGLLIAGNVVIGYKGDYPENYVCVIPDGITAIADQAFSDGFFANIIGYVLPESLEYIGDLRGELRGELVIPGKVVEINGVVWSDYLTKITFANGDTPVERCELSVSNSVKEVSLGRNFNSNNSVLWSSSLEKLSLTQGVTSVTFNLIPLYTVENVRELTVWSDEPLPLENREEEIWSNETYEYVTVNTTPLDNFDKSQCVLRVPQQAVEAYKSAPGWRDFYKIEGFVPTSVSDVEGMDTAEPVYFNLNGMRVAKPENGIFIVVRGSKVTKEYFK